MCLPLQHRNQHQLHSCNLLFLPKHYAILVVQVQAQVQELGLVQELVSVQGLEQAWVQELTCYCRYSNHPNCSAELPLYYRYFHYPYYHLPESLQNRRHRYCRYLRLPLASRS